LADASKLPREIISELHESSQVAKIITSKLPDFEFKDKAGPVTSAEVLAYYKAISTELSIVTFTPEK
jgi:hypothetical protein